jgi:hypothetical protein
MLYIEDGVDNKYLVPTSQNSVTIQKYSMYTKLSRNFTIFGWSSYKFNKKNYLD